jgi:hypothetical protein
MRVKEATVIDADYFDEVPADAAVVDSAVQEMARRQFGVSLVVGLMFLAVETAPNRIAGVQAPQFVKQPILATEQGIVK